MGKIHPTIPFELYRPIFEHVVFSKDLCTLARTSRASQSEAERLLYSYLEGRDLKNVVVICRRICNLARVGRYVRTIVFDYGADSRWYNQLRLSSFYVLVAQALYRTPNLIRLQIRPNSMGSLFDVILLHFPLSTFWSFRLRHFQTLFVSHHMFVRFLPNQQDVRYLDADVIDTWNSDLVIPSQFLPHLNCLKTHDVETISYFLSTRSITHLRTKCLLHDDLVQGAASLRLRALHSTFAVVSIPEIFPRLELLSVGNLIDDFEGRLCVVLGHQDDWSTMKQILSRLKNLRRFAFAYTDDRRYDVTDVVEVLTAFRDVCPTLQFAQLVSDVEDDFGKPTRTHPRDWEWDGWTWKGLPISDSLDIWEQSAMEVAMSGTIAG